jgi:sorbitol-specific phosphotransferase system component IIA
MSYQQRVKLGKDIRGLPLRAYTIVGGRRITIGMDIVDASKGEIVLTFQSEGTHNYKIEGIKNNQVYKAASSTITKQSTPVTNVTEVVNQTIVEGTTVTIGTEPTNPKVGDYWGVPV